MSPPLTASYYRHMTAKFRKWEDGGVLDLRASLRGVPSSPHALHRIDFRAATEVTGGETGNTSFPFYAFPDEVRRIIYTDQIDKRFVFSRAIFFWRGRPRGETSSALEAPSTA